MASSRTTSFIALMASLAGVAALLGLMLGPSNARVAAAAAPAAITASPEPSPPTSVPATSVPATSIPATSIPATSVPTTDVPPEHDGRPQVVLEKLVEPSGTARVGDEVSFTLIVSNRGDENAEDVVVTDPVPSAFEVLDARSDRGDVSVSGNTVVVSLGTVRPGDFIRISIRARITGASLDGANTASLATSSGDDDVADNVSSVTLRIDDTPATETPPPTQEPTPAATPTPQAAGGAPDTTRPVNETSPRTAPIQRLPETGQRKDPGAGLLLGLLGLVLAGLGLFIRRRQTSQG